MSEHTEVLYRTTTDDYCVSLCFSRSGHTYQSATPTTASVTAGLRYDLIAFLATAQRYNIDLLSLNWNPALDTAGRGGTAVIRQSRIRRQQFFAFKRYKPPTCRSDESITFRALISEMSILGHSRIKRHPNIVALYGICWDVLPEGGVWPVLVFEKAQMGNLKEFIRSDQGKSITFSEKYKICVDISAAIKYMHETYIIHGDIKPENILISKAENATGYVAQVIDFGYSTMRTDDPINMPRSDGWTAPEWHHRGFEFVDAEKMDVYSFGLLCLWLFTFDEQESISDHIRARMPAIVNKLLVEETTQADTLRRVLYLSLERDPANRRTLPFLSELLESTRQAPTQVIVGSTLMALSEPVVLPQEDNSKANEVSDKFELATSLAELYRTDFRVRTKIRETLGERANDTRSNPYDRQNDAFQLAFCYRLGFGTRIDREKASSYLKTSLQSQEMLAREINRAKCCASSYNPNSETIQILTAEKVLRSSNLIDQYRQQGKLAEAEAVCRKEVTDLCNVIGTSSYLTAIVRRQMASIASAMGRWNEAESFLMLAMQSVGGLEVEKLHLRNMIIDLATIYYRQERYREAEEVFSDVLLNQSKDLPEDHLERLEMLGVLAAIYVEQGKLHLAEEWFAQLVKIQSRLLGPEHEVTLKNMAMHALVIQTQGRWNEAEELRKRELELSSQNLGANHRRTQECLANLATLFQVQGRWQEAKVLGEQILDTSIATHGPDHPQTLTLRSNLAGILSDQGLWKEAEKMYLQCIEGDQRRLGPDSPTALIWSGNLASVYHKQGKYHDAEKIERSIVDKRQSILGRSHPSTLSSMSNLAATYYVQDKFTEAEKLEVEVMETCRKTLGEHHPDTLSAKASLATTYIHQKKWKDAGAMLEEAAAVSKQVLGSDHPDTLSTLDKLGSVYCHEARWHEAEDLYLTNIQVKTRLFGAEHHSTLDSMFDLAITYWHEDKIAESMKLHRTVLALRSKVLGEDHPDTRASFKFVSGERVPSL